MAKQLVTSSSTTMGTRKLNHEDSKNRRNVAGRTIEAYASKHGLRKMYMVGGQPEKDRCAGELGKEF